MEKEEKKEEPKDEVEITQVITGTAPAFRLPDDRVVSLEEYLVWLGNLIYKIKKNLG